jgi:hypothetical protein
MVMVMHTDMGMNMGRDVVIRREGGSFQQAVTWFSTSSLSRENVKHMHNVLVHPP